MRGHGSAHLGDGHKTVARAAGRHTGVVIDPVIESELKRVVLVHSRHRQPEKEGFQVGLDCIPGCKPR